MTDFDKLQYEQAYSFFKTIIQQFYQVTTILYLVNATIVGFAINGSTNLLLLGAVLLLAVLISNHRAGSLILPIVFQILNIEKKYGNNIPLIKTIFLKTNAAHLICEMEKLIDIEGDLEQFFESKQVRLSILSRNSKIVIIIFAIGQLLFPIMLEMIKCLNTMHNTLYK